MTLSDRQPGITKHTVWLCISGCRWFMPPYLTGGDSVTARHPMTACKRSVASVPLNQCPGQQQQCEMWSLAGIATHGRPRLHETSPNKLAFPAVFGDGECPSQRLTSGTDCHDQLQWFGSHSHTLGRYQSRHTVMGKVRSAQGA